MCLSHPLPSTKWEIRHKVSQKGLLSITALTQCQERAVDGAMVRKVFSSSPRDPRYHMLSYISNKFTQPAMPHMREPRAALILNRFTRSSTIMYATKGVEQILGFSPSDLVKKSFYYCVSENCLSDAVRTVESAKHNDSIAYLRFVFRDPTLPDPAPVGHGDSDSEESEDGGVPLSRASSVSMPSDFEKHDRVNGHSVPQIAVTSPQINGVNGVRDIRDHPVLQSIETGGSQSRTSSGNSTDLEGNASDRIFDRDLRPGRSSETMSTSPGTSPSNSGAIEIEAVVSCTSDGLVVVLRRAHSLVPEAATPYEDQPRYPNGLFASPWASEPILPDGMTQASSVPGLAYPAVGEPLEAGFMSAIRDVAVFAWSLTGINGSLIDLAIGSPRDEAIPPGGLPIWDPNAPVGQNDKYNGFSGGTHRPVNGQRNYGEVDSEITSSDDEIVWKRVPQMPAYRRPKRRAHCDAFGLDEDSTDNGGVAVQDGRRRRKLENGQRHDS